jgi:long-chain acyl-CoA synthetase
MTALCTGGHLIFTERLEPFTWAEVVRRETVEVSRVVPTLLPMLMAAGVTAEKVPTLRHLLVSSAPPPRALGRAFSERSRVRLVQGWGLSEYTNFACCIPPGLSDSEHAALLLDEETPSVGPALPGTEVRVVGADGNMASEGERGELHVRGHSTMLGYLDDAAATARTIDAEGWMRTGDEGYWRSVGGRAFFHVTGRLKEIIIRDGEKYSPLRLEQHLVEAVPELSGKLVVLGFPSADHGEEVGAYLETDALGEPLRARLLAAIAEMPLAERPKLVLHGSRSIARTHTGKVQRGKMTSWFPTGAKGGAVPTIVKVEGE